MSNSPASVNDIVSDEHRALAFGFWSIGPTNGPVYGPIIRGFIFLTSGMEMDKLDRPYHWRWCPVFDGCYQRNVCSGDPEVTRRMKEERNAKPKVVDTL